MNWFKPKPLPAPSYHHRREEFYFARGVSWLDRRYPQVPSREIWSAIEEYVETAPGVISRAIDPDWFVQVEAILIHRAHSMKKLAHDVLAAAEEQGDG